MNDIKLAQSIVKRCQDGGYGLGISEAGIPTLSNPTPDLDPALLTDMAMCPPQALRAVLIGQSVLEAMPTEQPALLEVPPNAALATALQHHREHTGEQFEEDYPELVQMAVSHIMANGLNYSSLAKLIGPLCGRTTEGQLDGLRKILRPIVKRRLSVDDINKLTIAETALGVLEGVSATRESIEAAAGKAGNVQSLAIASKTLNEIKQLATGGATRITGKAGDGNQKDAEYYRRKAQQAIQKEKEAAVEVEAEIFRQEDSNA